MGAHATGVQRFAFEIARRLWIPVEDRVLFLPRGVAPPADIPEGVAVLGGLMTGHAWERFELTRLGRRAGCDVFLHLANTLPGGGGPHVVVVHDVEPLVRPDAFAASFVAWYRWAVAPAVRRAARVVTVSRASARMIVEVVGVDPDRIRVADQGAAPLDVPADVAAVAAVQRRFALGGPYLLAVGGSDPRKNVAFLRVVIARWRVRRGRGEGLGAAPALVVVNGGDARIFPGHGPEPLEVCSGELRLGRMDDASLRALYTGAAALAFPSLSEGFGRPPLEAMACGTPVVAARYPAAPEVLGDAAELLPLEPDVWVDVLDGILREDPAAAASRRERGRARAAAHSWDAGVEVVLAACREAAGEGDSTANSPAPRYAEPRPVPSTAPPAAAPVSLSPFAEVRVALVHDWLTSMRGGEKVLEALLDLFPRADLFTLLHVQGSVSEAIEARRVHTSFVQGLPASARRYRAYLPLFPRAIESFDLTGYDLVVSSSHCVAKGVQPPPGIPHLSYCHTPMRYLWDQKDSYLAPGRAHPLTRAAAPLIINRLRRWDRDSAARVDHFVANSEHVRERIRRYWGRPSEVVHPPVEVERFHPGTAREDFYLVVSALVPYKRVELAIEACDQLGRRLVVVGDGPDLRRLRQRAGATVRIAGRVSDFELASLMGRCRALVHPAVEDFGIVMVEAQAAGAPVLAAGLGGALESVIPPGGGDEPTGLFFEPESAEALVDAMLELDRLCMDPAAAVANAQRFGRARFLRGMTAEIAAVLAPPAGG